MKLEITVRPGLTRYLDPLFDDAVKKTRVFHESVDIILEFEVPVTLEMILHNLQIPIEECGIVIYNQKRLSIEDYLMEDGILKIYPPILGG